GERRGQRAQQRDRYGERGHGGEHGPVPPRHPNFRPPCSSNRRSTTSFSGKGRASSAATTTAVALVLGVFRVAAGALTPGDLIVVHAYARRLYPRMRAVGHERARLTRATAGGDRIAGV